MSLLQPIFKPWSIINLIISGRQNFLEIFLKQNLHWFLNIVNLLLLYSLLTSPPILVLDIYFEGQEKDGIQTNMLGLVHYQPGKQKI